MSLSKYTEKQLLEHINALDTFYTGQTSVSAAGTAEALAASQPLERGVVVKANSGITGDIYVGDSTVSSTTGFILAPGEEIFIPVDDLSKVYIDADSTGAGVSYKAA